MTDEKELISGISEIKGLPIFTGCDGCANCSIFRCKVYNDNIRTIKRIQLDRGWRTCPEFVEEEEK
jgi:hypothetical protein